MSKFCLLVATATLLACSPYVQAQVNHPLTLKEALELARSHNPSLAAQRAQLESVKAGEVTAALRPNPELSIAKEDLGASQFSPLDQTFNVSQTLERGGKRHFRMESAQISTTLARYSYQDFERQLLLSVKQSFVSLLLTRANLALAQENRRDYEKTLEMSQIRFSAGDISRTDLDRIEIQASRFQSDALSATLAMMQAREQLQALLGTTLPPGFEVAGELKSSELKIDAAQLRQQALASRPDYLAAVEQVRKAEAEVRLADANGATDVTAGAEYKRNGPENFAGITLGIPLRIFDRNQGEKLRTRRDLDGAHASEMAARNLVISDVNQALAAYDTAVQLAELYNLNYLDRARQVRDRVEFSYRNGATSLLDYLEAVREYRDTELASHAAEAQLMNAIHQLSFVTQTELLP
jgi:cobalt-zinc-cadmium efflux system outer membrane protein